MNIRTDKPCSIISMFDGVGMAAGYSIVCDLRTSSSFSSPQRRYKTGSLTKKLRKPVPSLPEEVV